MISSSSRNNGPSTCSAAAPVLVPFAQILGERSPLALLTICSPVSDPGRGIRNNIVMYHVFVCIYIYILYTYIYIYVYT